MLDTIITLVKDKFKGSSVFCVGNGLNYMNKET